MMYRTHKAGGALAMALAFEYFRAKHMLVPGMNEYVQLLIMYPASSWGSTAPDLDHHWGSVKEKTPFNMFVHKLLHFSHPKHRSWQTHSLLVTGGFCALLYSLVTYGSALFPGLGSTDWIILKLIFTGFLTGIVSHLVLDSMSTAGIHIWPGLKFRVVPRSSFFATDSKWETFVYYTCIVLTAVVVLNVGLGHFGINIWEELHRLLTLAISVFRG